jgi:hypothetical protein
MFGVGKISLFQVQPILAKGYSELSITKMLDDISLSETDKGKVFVTPEDDLKTLL